MKTHTSLIMEMFSMKILVTYRSVTGNTKKIAEAIYSEIKTDKDIKSFTEVENLDNYDFVFVGYPVEGYGPSEATKKWLQKHVNGKKVGIFTTHGAPENSPNLAPWIDAINTAATDTGAEVVASFNCQADMSDYVVNMLKNDPDPNVQQWGHMYRAQGLPDESRVEKAKEFARETMKKI
jgi:flavodoxin